MSITMSIQLQVEQSLRVSLRLLVGGATGFKARLYSENAFSEVQVGRA